jgi:predicted signal transduction protein with EAL and GGDEF domain
MDRKTPTQGPPPEGPDIEPDAESWALQRRVDLLYEGLPVSLFAIVLGAALPAWLISRGAPTPTELGWLALALGVSALRVVGYLHFFRGSGAEAPNPVRLRWAMAGVFASALVWGLASVVLFNPGDASGQVVLAFVLAGISAGAVTTVSVFAWAAIAVSLLVLTPLILRLLLSDTELGPGVALMCLLYLALLIGAVRRFNRTIIDSLRMRHAREQAEAHLERQVFFDPLTNLPNRRLLMEHLRQDLALTHRHGPLGAVAFIDLDQFKTINDFGPEAVAKQVPEMSKMLELREALNALKGPLGNIPAFRKKIQAIIQDETARAAILAELGQKPA